MTKRLRAWRAMMTAGGDCRKPEYVAERRAEMKAHDIRLRSYKPGVYE